MTTCTLNYELRKIGLAPDLQSVATAQVRVCPFGNSHWLQAVTKHIYLTAEAEGRQHNQKFSHEEDVFWVNMFMYVLLLVIILKRKENIYSH